MPPTLEAGTYSQVAVILGVPSDEYDTGLDALRGNRRVSTFDPSSAYLVFWSFPIPKLAAPIAPPIEVIEELIETIEWYEYNTPFTTDGVIEARVVGEAEFPRIAWDE